MKKLTLIPILLLFIGYSCTDENMNNKKVDEVAIDANVLSFKDHKEMLAYIKNPEAHKGGFESYEDIYNKAIDQIEAAKNEAERAQLLNSYHDIVIFSNEAYSPVLNNQVYRTICNREGLYISEGYVHKVFNDQFIVLTKKKNINALRSIKTLDNLDKSIFKMIKYQNSSSALNNGRTSTSCGNYFNVNYFHNESNCRNDRRVYLVARAFYIVSSDYYAPWVYAGTWGTRRQGTSCNWTRYNTRLSSANCSFTVESTFNGETMTFEYNTDEIPDYTGELDEYEHEIFFATMRGTFIQWDGVSDWEIGFGRIHMEANSRGLNANEWAVIDCQ